MTKRASMRDRPIVRTPARDSDDALMAQEMSRVDVIALPVNQIMPNQEQPRTSFEETALQELAASVTMHGVLQPILVRSIQLTEYEGTARSYQIVAGERRWRASRLAGLETIPCILLDQNLSNEAVTEMAVVENLQRVDLHPLDEAMAFERMQRELGYSFTAIAERIGKSKGYVQNRLNLLKLPENLQGLIIDRPDTISHVQDINRLTDPSARAALIAAVRDEGLSRAETRRRVDAFLSGEQTSTAESYVQTYERDNIHNSDEWVDGPKSYVQTYERDNIHNDDERADEQKSYVQTYERDNIHNQTAQERYQQGASADDSGQLNARQRMVLAQITQRLQGWIADPSTLTTDDWNALEPLADRLRVLLETHRSLGE